MTPYLYEADATAFLDRARRARRLLDQVQPGKSINVADWTAAMTGLLREVDPLPLVLGVRYRVRTFGGQPNFTHLHAVDETGKLHGLDLPTLEGMGIVELQGVFRGRPPDGPWHGLVDLEMDGKHAYLADSDLLRVEEVT